MTSVPEHTASPLFAITTVPQVYLRTGGLDWSMFISGKDSKDSSLGTN